jgi:hypothetical protein
MRVLDPSMRDFLRFCHVGHSANIRGIKKMMIFLIENSRNKLLAYRV